MKDRITEKERNINNQIRMIKNSIQAIVDVQGSDTPDKRVRKIYPQKIQRLGQELPKTR